MWPTYCHSIIYFVSALHNWKQFFYRTYIDSRIISGSTHSVCFTSSSLSIRYYTYIISVSTWCDNGTSVLKNLNMIIDIYIIICTICISFSLFHPCTSTFLYIPPFLNLPYSIPLFIIPSLVLYLVNKLSQTQIFFLFLEMTNMSPPLHFHEISKHTHHYCHNDIYKILEYFLSAPESENISMYKMLIINNSLVHQLLVSSKHTDIIWLVST